MCGKRLGKSVRCDGGGVSREEGGGCRVGWVWEGRCG